MAKKKMPPQLLEYFKNKNEKKEDGSKMSDKEKRTAALDKARKAKKAAKTYKDKKEAEKPKIRSKLVFNSSLIID